MTVFEAEIELYKWFNENHSFEISRDFPRIVLVTDSPEDDKAAVLSALKEFEINSLVSSSRWEDKDYWVLRRPFESVPQSVNINAGSALAISSIINNFCEITGDDTDRCDPKSIREQDIANLITICTLAWQEENKDTLE